MQALHSSVTRFVCNHPMLLQRTLKAQRELLPGQRTLSLRERSLLLLAQDTPIPQLQAMYHGEGAQLLQRLLRQGYLQALRSDALPSIASTNLAGLRMHLFDLCERFFANRQPRLAEQLRTALRDARDACSMQSVVEQLLQAVQLHAGAERAEALREQIMHWLPASSLETVEADSQ